ncbi:GABA permease, putative [Talaromyces stipitatus ATCC 10500]|uniref:GABA permease, putative n=1 Tax=Talaromyces stipitatus (strain ATCC 10500 / CBS 375.48 / QM 6759 / NRRL 1006) TaxID=441959 RepID=B8MCE5_TALSN|nr:GABA permease, putative [Talaromyces stipitatus ATCC 10500]EED18761.1 GABA permease, putative [Talaromyces stipitatus ATCC 10500]
MAQSESLKMNSLLASREAEAHFSSKQQRDEAGLARLGKRSVLKRNFGFMAVLGFSTTILITWEGLFTGGPAGTVYGYIFVWAGTAAIFAMLSEMVSMAPTSGGQYHWCSMLASSRTMKFSSYVTGWLTVVGWQATFATACYLSGTTIQGLIALSNPSYVPHPWHSTLLYWSVVAFGLVINTVGGATLLPKFEGLILVLHIIGFFAVLIPLVYMSDHGSAKDVFATWFNEGGWDTQGLSFFVGLIGVVFAFAGGDAAVHMAEETQNAPKIVPISIMFSVVINGVLGFAMLIASLFCLGNLQDDLNSPTGYPFMAIFLQGTGSVAGATAMSAIVGVMAICATTGMLATASRMFWAFARDRGVPGWRLWSQVSPQAGVPVNAVIFTATVSTLLGLIPLGSPVAFNDLTSMSTSGLYLSYMVCCILLLYRRCTGGIITLTETSSVASPADDEQIVNTAGAKLVWGPFHLKGIVGIAVNVFAIVYMLITVFFSFWPPTAEVTVSTMNYSAVGTVGTMTLSLLYYFFRARHVYEGPIVEI